MHLIFTDLDGLLDHYLTLGSGAAGARLPEAPARPWMLVTSKTQAEVELWRRILGNEHPFIVENGGAAFPGRLPARTCSGSEQRDAYEVIEWACRTANWLTASKWPASQPVPCRGFHGMTVEVLHVPTAFGTAVLATQRSMTSRFILDRIVPVRLWKPLSNRAGRTRGASSNSGANDKACGQGSR